MSLRPARPNRQRRSRRRIPDATCARSLRKDDRMLTPRVGRAAKASGRPGLIRPALPLVAGLLFVSSLPAPAIPQVTFDQAMTDIASPDAKLRLRTAQMLKEAAYPEA